MSTDSSNTMMLTLPVFRIRRPTKVTPAHATPAQAGLRSCMGETLACLQGRPGCSAPIREATKHDGASTDA